jgi:hypothetical protein
LEAGAAAAADFVTEGTVAAADSFWGLAAGFTGTVLAAATTFLKDGEACLGGAALETAATGFAKTGAAGLVGTAGLAKCTAFVAGTTAVARESGTAALRGKAFEGVLGETLPSERAADALLAQS